MADAFGILTPGCVVLPRWGKCCIDAADGDAAPATDMGVNTRFDDPATPNTGTGVPGYADMGAYEYRP